MADTRNSAPSGASNTAEAPDSNRDRTILTAFARWQAAHTELAALQTDDDKAEKELWNVVDAADTEIHATPATTPEGIAPKLWLAIVHSTPDHETEEAACRGDIDWLEKQGGALDWNLRQIASALRDLKTMEARILPIVAVTPPDDPVSRYWTAFHVHNADQLDADTYTDAFLAMHKWTPQTPRDFVRKYEAAYSISGCPTQENQDRLVEQAVAILGVRAGKEG
jgi:hypothetical protein